VSTSTARRTTTLVVALVVAIGLALAALLLPVPYVELSPGETCNVLTTCPDVNGKNVTVLKIDHHTYPTNGHLNLTTVSLSGGPGDRRLTLFQALRGWLDQSVAVVPRDLLFSASQSADQVDCQNTKDQQSSQNTATTAALRNLGYTVPVTNEVFVTGFSVRSPARVAGIGVCDDITSIDGQQVTSDTQLPKLIEGHAVGDTVTVGYTVNGSSEKKTARVTLVASPDAGHGPIIGITSDQIEHSHPPFKVTINVGAIGGPSAGLMYALGIIDQLTPGDLTGGTFVAGTGEIDDNGKVGEIGGIQQKLIGAHDEGATVFLVPTANCGEALQSHPKGLRLISVGTLKDALNALTALRHEPDGVIHDCTR
jgi:PDZ domain-containing protein